MGRPLRMALLVLCAAVVAGGCQSGRDTSARLEDGAVTLDTVEGSPTTTAPTAAPPDSSTPSGRGPAPSSASSKPGASTGTPLVLPPVTGRRLRDVHYRAKMTATISVGRGGFKDAKGVFHLRRGVEGDATNLQWSRPDGGELDIHPYQMVKGPDGWRGHYQDESAGGMTHCEWDTRPLLQFPANPKAGDVFKEHAECHTKSMQVVYDQELRVLGPTTAVVDGVEVAAWKIQRLQQFQASGASDGKGDADGQEVWVAGGADPPLLVSAVKSLKGSAGVIQTGQESEFVLEKTLPPS